MVEVKREIVAVDADVFCEGFDGDSRGAVEFVFNPILECDGDLFFFLCPNFILVSIAPPNFLWPYLWVWGLLRLARWSRGSLSSFHW